MKIAVLTPIFFPFDGGTYLMYGGVEPYLEGLINYWCEMGHEVSVVTGFASEKWIESDNLKVFPSDHQPTYRDTYNDDERPLFLKYQKEILDCDVIFDQTHFFPSYREKQLLEFDIPIFSHFHHAPGNVRTLPPSDRNRMYSISKWQSSLMRANLDAEFPIIYSGIRRELFPNSPFTPNERKTFIFLARFSTTKGAHLILNLAKKYPQYNFDLYGDVIFTQEPYYGYILLKQNYKIPNIRVFANVTWEEKLEALQNADGLIHLPLIQEPGSINFIEMMRYGHPVFTWNDGSFPEMIRNFKDGILVDRDMNDMSGSVDLAYDTFEDFAEHNFDRFSIMKQAEKFDLRDTAKKWLYEFENNI